MRHLNKSIKETRDVFHNRKNITPKIPTNTNGFLKQFHSHLFYLDIHLDLRMLSKKISFKFHRGYISLILSFVSSLNVRYF